ncbi:hypothetical protein ES707_21061 [subsurface metagenome]
MVTTIYGGFDFTIYTSDDTDGADATPRGITTRINPILDTSNINIRGTGNRGLYDILLGMRQPQFTMDILPSEMKFITLYQNGQNGPGRLHLKQTVGDGLTFKEPRFNRVSVEARHNEAISATIEVWAESLQDLTTQSWDPFTAFEPYRWLHSTLDIGTETEDAWWSWRYEVNNNFQRLGNVDDGGTRAIKPRHREVTGLIVKDLASFSEWVDLMILEPDDPDLDKFDITIQVDGLDGPSSGGTAWMIKQPYCRWGRLEAPFGPEDLIAKRFPFTALDIT